MNYRVSFSYGGTRLEFAKKHGGDCDLESGKRLGHGVRIGFLVNAKERHCEVFCDGA